MFKDSKVTIVFGNWRKNPSVIAFQIVKRNKNPIILCTAIGLVFFLSHKVYSLLKTSQQLIQTQLKSLAVKKVCSCVVAGDRTNHQCPVLFCLLGYGGISRRSSCKRADQHRRPCIPPTPSAWSPSSATFWVQSACICLLLLSIIQRGSVPSTPQQLLQRHVRPSAPLLQQGKGQHLCCRMSLPGYQGLSACGFWYCFGTVIWI